MIETIATLNSLVLLSCCALALYGALVFRKHFGLVSPLWALAIPVTKMTSFVIGTYISLRDPSKGWVDIYKRIGAKAESSFGITTADVFVYIPAIKSFFEKAGYLLVILIVLSDLARLLKRNDIAKPRFLPIWSNRTTHVVGALAIVCCLLHDWFPILALLLPDAQ